MRWSQTLIPTMKETPEGAEIPSHVLMLRAGLINQLMAGAYTYLPLGYRALRKAEQIVREEMDQAGAVEVHMPALTPIHLWEQTGRVEAFGNVLIKFDVRRQGKKVHMALGPDARRDRHRSGVEVRQQLSATAADAVPDSDQVPQRRAAAVRRAADQRILDEGCVQLRHVGRRPERQLRQDVRGLLHDLPPLRTRLSGRRGRERPDRRRRQPRVHGASPTTAKTRSSTIPRAATRPTQERAETGKRTVAKSTVEPKPLTKLHTPNVGSIEAVSKFLKCKPHQMLKTLIYTADDKPIAVLIRGDHEANENKIRRAVGAKKLALAEPAMVEASDRRAGRLRRPGRLEDSRCRSGPTTTSPAWPT